MPEYTFRIVSPVPLTADVLKRIREAVEKIITEYAKYEVTIELKPKGSSEEFSEESLEEALFGWD